MVNSMTAFGTASGQMDGLNWAWEIRSVNGRGLDLRVRMPDGCDPLEAVVRKQVGRVAVRGSINVFLKLKQEVVAGAAAVNPVALQAAVAAAQEAASVAQAAGLAVEPFDPVGVLRLPGVFGVQDSGDRVAQAHKQMQRDLAVAVAGFAQARAAEGAALAKILEQQIDQIDALCAKAAVALEPRAERVAQTLRANVAKLMAENEALDEARLAQELALLAVKADVAEELDRLTAHVSAARDLLATKGPIGRKFDFLTQEFNREANTLCSKANFAALTEVGLDLKTTIDQMREQVQNVE